MAGHDHWLALGSIKGDAQIKLAFYIRGLLHEDLLDLLAFRAGLVGDELHAENQAGRLASLCGASGQFDAPALAATSSVDLGLDHDLSTQFGGHAFGLIRCRGHVAARYGDLVLVQNFFGLIFVNFHGHYLFY